MLQLAAIPTMHTSPTASCTRRSFTHYLPTIYPLFTHCLPTVYSLLPTAYPLLTHCLPTVTQVFNQPMEDLISRLNSKLDQIEMAIGSEEEEVTELQEMLQVPRATQSAHDLNRILLICLSESVVVEVIMRNLLFQLVSLAERSCPGRYKRPWNTKITPNASRSWCKTSRNIYSTSRKTWQICCKFSVSLCHSVVVTSKPLHFPSQCASVGLLHMLARYFNRDLPD